MPRQVINTTAPGDTAKAGGDKINAMTLELYPTVFHRLIVLPGDQTVTARTWCDGSNVVSTIPIYLEAPVSLTNLGVALQALSVGGKKMAIGLFSTAGTRLVQTGLMTEPGSAPALLSGAAVYSAASGLYILAYGSDGTNTTAPSLACTNVLATSTRFILNAAGTYFGTAANAMDGSGLPATLGTITAAGGAKVVPFFVLW